MNTRISDTPCIYFFKFYVQIYDFFLFICLMFFCFIFHFFLISTYSGGQNKVGQCFFANVNLLALSMVTMKIFIYLL
jgi:hypothetical protein